MEREFSVDEYPFLNQGYCKECVGEILGSVTADTRVIRCVVIKDRNTDVFMPQLSSPACFDLQF